MNRTRIFPVRLLATALALCVLLAAGCATSNVVGLDYPRQLSDTPWCRWDVTLIPFADERTTTTLGAMDEQVDYRAASDVTEWVARSLTRELATRGCECTWSPEVPEQGGGFVVGGSVRQMRLDKTGINQWTTHMRLRVELMRGGELLFGQEYKGMVERTFLLPAEGPEKIMAEALAELLGDAATALTEAMKDASR